MTGVAPVANVGGKISPAESACVPILDRGFLYGDSVYEVFRTYSGVPFLFEEHWERLQRSAAMIHLDPLETPDGLRKAISKTVTASGAAEAGADVYVRYTFTRGSGPVDLNPDQSARPLLVILVKAVPQWTQESYSRGVTLAIPPTRRNAATTLSPNIKGGNYLNNVIGVIEARERGAEDCLFLDQQGLLTECSNSNVVFARNGELFSPSQRAANLEGLTKMIVGRVASEQGVSMAETELDIAAIDSMDECFITSATREIMPVASITLEDGSIREFPVGGGPLTRRMMTGYRDYVQHYVAERSGDSLFT